MTRVNNLGNDDDEIIKVDRMRFRKVCSVGNGIVVSVRIDDNGFDNSKFLTSNRNGDRTQFYGREDLKKLKKIIDDMLVNY